MRKETPKKRFLEITASTECNDIVSYIRESEDIESLVAAAIGQEAFEIEKVEIMNLLKKEGSVLYPNEDEPFIEVFIRRGKSPFGTDEAEVRVWRDFVLERYSQTYIELPQNGV